MIGLVAYQLIQSNKHEPWPEDFIKKANIYFNNHQFEPLKTYCLERIKSNPKDYNGYWYLGLCYQNERQYNNAITQYKKAISLCLNIEHLKVLNENIRKCKEKIKNFRAN